MYFITTKRMLEVCFSAHPNIQYRTLIFFGKSFMCSPPFYDLIIAYTYVYVKQNMYIYKFLHLRIFAGAFIMP